MADVTVAGTLQYYYKAKSYVPNDSKLPLQNRYKVRNDVKVRFRQILKWISEKNIEPKWRMSGVHSCYIRQSSQRTSRVIEAEVPGDKDVKRR